MEPAGVVDEGHGRVPVTRGLVPGAELVAPLLLDLVEGGRELLVRLRRGLDARGGEDVLAPVGDAATGVVRDAVGLALVGDGGLEAVQPGVGVVELRRVDGSEGSLDHVGEHLRVAHLDHVGGLVGGEDGVELGVLVGPAVVLVLDGDPGVLLLDRRVGGLDQLRPVVLRVHREPDRQLLGVRAGVRALALTAPARRDGDHHARDTDRDRQLPLHATLLRDAIAQGCHKPPAPRGDRRTAHGARTWTNGVDQ